jgi:hypothetical protein
MLNNAYLKEKRTKKSKGTSKKERKTKEKGKKKG